jgi:hypothetical protein
MKIRDLIEKLGHYKQDSEVFFEEQGNNQGGESETFALDIKEIYCDGEDTTIVVQVI